MMTFVYWHIGKVARSQNERIWAGEHSTSELAERKRKEIKEIKWVRTISKFVSLLLNLIDLTCLLSSFFSKVLKFDLN